MTVTVDKAEMGKSGGAPWFSSAKNVACVLGKTLALSAVAGDIAGYATKSLNIGYGQMMEVSNVLPDGDTTDWLLDKAWDLNTFGYHMSGNALDGPALVNGVGVGLATAGAILLYDLVKVGYKALFDKKPALQPMFANNGVDLSENDLSRKNPAASKKLKM